LAHVFISYSRVDQAYVKQLADHLSGLGLDVWYDYEIDAGEPFGPRIQAAIDDCCIFLPVLTPASAASKWVRREIGYADILNKPIMPLMLAPCNRPIEVSLLQYEDVTGGTMPPARLVDRLRAVAAGPPVVVPGTTSAVRPASAVRSAASAPVRTGLAARRPVQPVHHEPMVEPGRDEWVAPADPARFWTAVRMDPVEIALPGGVGRTIRAYRKTDDNADGEVPSFLTANDRLLLFHDPANLVAFVRTNAEHSMAAVSDWWRVRRHVRVEHIVASDDDTYELDLVVENLRGGTDAWVPSLIIKAGEIGRDLGYALQLDLVASALAASSPLDDIDDALRNATLGGWRAVVARRRLRKVPAQQTALAWRTIIGKISAAVDWRD
jgi:hypothetical protein